MATMRASRELLAPPEDVWGFLSELRHLADWWPGVAAVELDRRGVAAGARWKVRSRGATLFRRRHAEDTLVVTAATPMARFAFELARARVKADLLLQPAGPGRTSAELRVEEPFSFGFRRGRRAADALARLHDLVQAAADV